MHVASLGFRTDLGINRLSGAEISARDDYIVVRTPAIPDYWWGNYVLLPRPLEPGRAERARSVFVSEFPSAPHVAIGVDGTDGDPGDPQAVEALGVKVEVNTVLSAERLRRPARSNGGPGEKATFRPLADDDDWAQAIEPPTKLLATPFGYAVAPGDQIWLNYLNLFVDTIKRNGELQEAASKNNLGPIVAP